MLFIVEIAPVTSEIQRKSTLIFLPKQTDMILDRAEKIITYPHIFAIESNVPLTDVVS